MKIFLQIGVALAIATSSLGAAAACNARVAVVASAGVKHKVSAPRASQLLCEIGSQLGLDPAQVKIVLMQMLPDEADIADVRPATLIRELRYATRPGSVYLVSMVGEDDDLTVATLLGSALLDSLGSHLTPKEFMAVVHRALVISHATVDKNALLESRP